MKFRKLYWVTEQIGQDGQSEVVGVFTSTYDLITKGMRWDEEVDKKSGFRLSLVKLDSLYKPFGTWQSPNYDGFEGDLQRFVQTGEFEQYAVDEVAAKLREFSQTKVG